MKPIRSCLTAAPVLIGVFLLPGAALPQTYPDRPVRVVVGVAPGGTVDFLARMLAPKLSDAWSQPVVIDNRPGANGIIAAEYVAKSKPDGQTLLIVNAAHANNPSVYRKLPYDTLADFDPVTLLAQFPFILVIHPSVPARSVKELIAVAKAKPGELSFASAGNGSPTHLGMELFKHMAGVEMVHVPYKGAGPASTDLVAGHVQVMLFSLATVQGMIRAGRLRALAVADAARSRVMPELPTASESGLPGFTMLGWYAMLIPAGTPRPVRAKLHGDVVKALRAEDVRERLAVENAEPVGNTPEEFADFLQKEIVKYAGIVKRIGVKLD